MQQSNKPTSSNDEPFQEWIGTEVTAVLEFAQARGMTPAQAGYAFAIALAYVVNTQSTPKDDKTGLPLIQLGNILRPQAIKQWDQSQIVN